jgi:phytol kinase
MRIVYGYLLSYLYIIGVLAVVTVVKRLNRSENNGIYRKTVHILIPFTWIPLYIFLFGTWHFVVIPLSFIFITALSVKFDLIKIIERDPPIGKDFGIIYYSISMTILCFVATVFPKYLVSCGIGVFALSFGDGTAALLGQVLKKRNRHITKTKTIIGSLACFIFAIIGTLVLRMITPFQLRVASLLVIGITATIMEIIGGRYDNYTVPFGTTIAASLMRVGEV